MNRSPEHIRSLLIEVIDGNASLAQINELVRLVHEMAHVRIQQYVAKSKTKLLDQGVSLTSLAMDSTAELFARNDQGDFIVFSEYFREIRSSSPGETVVALRALVFESLHDNIVQMYQEIDPAYAKILRTLRRVLPSIPGATIVGRFGDTVLIAGDEERLELPQISLEDLQRLFAPALIKSSNLKTALLSLPHLLAGQEIYARSCPILTLALAIKQVYARVSSSTDIQNDEMLGFKVDLHNVLQDSYDEFEQWFMRKYLSASKIDESLAQAYLAGCRDFLTATFIEMDGEGRKHWDYLGPHLPEVTYAEYRSKHRSVFEYSVNKCFKIAREHLKEMA